jgi:proline dehydrogenase
MGDYLSLSLSQNGYNISKYLVYGPIERLMPFFSRRLIENSDILGGSVKETDRLKTEMKRRLFNF